MLMTLLLVFAGLAVVATAIIAIQPNDFSITRETKINAPAENIFPHVNNLHQWEPWSPWAKLDPDAKNTFEGPDAGEGATMKWDGNNKVGAGVMTVTESKPSSLVNLHLRFIRPFKSESMAQFTFTPDRGQTIVRWTMTGKNNFIGKLMSLVMNCDDMVGKQFDQGLANLKAVAEQPKA